VRETVATAELDDGRRLAGRIERPLGELLVDQAGAQWLRFDRPRLDAEQLLALRELTFEPRWKIDDIQGLTPTNEMIP
jgi:hypothetical protein